MKSVRLLPVVICAALALLLFKGIGLVTNGGYVLTGATMAQEGGEGSGGEGGQEAGNDATMELPVEPTLSDASPTLEDGAPTMPMRAKGGEGGGEPAAAKEGGEGGGEPDAAAADPEAEPAAAQPEACPAAAQDVGEGGCPLEPGGDAARDGPPVIRDGAGNVVPLDGSASGAEQAVLERLGARRDELDAREAELEMRMALVEAAEKRMAERSAALAALEARINALVEEKKATEEKQFASIVAMYETMKPKEAALIFDQLEMPVLLRVAGAMSPRKMAPIMAKMLPQKAKELTANMAVRQAEAAIEIGPEDLSALPQIVGQ